MIPLQWANIILDSLLTLVTWYVKPILQAGTYTTMELCFGVFYLIMVKWASLWAKMIQNGKWSYSHITGYKEQFLIVNLV